MGNNNYSGENIEWHHKKIKEYFDECFNTVYNPFLSMSDTLLIPALVDFINDETHTGPEAESAKTFLNDKQIEIIGMIVNCIQQLQGKMQGKGFQGSVPLLEDFLSDLSEEEKADPVIKTQHLTKIIEDFAKFNTVYCEVHPKISEIHDNVEEVVKGCGAVSRKSYTKPNPSALIKALDDFTVKDKTDGFVPKFNEKFLKFHEEHSNDIEGSEFKDLLDQIVELLKSIITGMEKGTFDITRYEQTRDNIKWINPKDIAGLEEYLKTYKAYLQGLVDRCQVYKYDPVNMSSGNYINDRTDFEIGTDTKISFRRFYNARSDFKGAMGHGWSCNSDVRLIKEDNGDIRAIYIDGREGIYRKPENSKLAKKETAVELTFDGAKEDTQKTSVVSETYYEIHGEPGKLVEDNYGYKLIKEDFSYEEYDKDGYLVAKGDNTGENTRYTLDVFTKTDNDGESIRYSLPVKIETKEGSYISLFYNEDGILTRVSSSQGKNVTYEYEKREDEYFLTTATYPNGSTRRYTYNESGLIHKVISPDGIIALTNEYDEQRRVIHQIFPDGGEMSYSYDDEKNITTATEQNGLKVEYLSDERGRHIGTRYVGLSDDYTSQDVADAGNIIEEKYTYNDRNQKTSVTDKNGHTVRFSYDNRGNLTKIVGPEGLSESYTYDAEGRLIVKKDSEGNSYRYIYDFDGNLYSVTDPLGNRIKYDYKDGRVVRIRDAENNAISVTYDEKGNISSIIDKAGVTTRYICDNSGRVTKTIDAEGNETSYTYDENDNLTSVTDPLGNITRYAYNTAGLLEEIVNPNGTIKTWTYNEIGKPAFYTDEECRTTHITYNTSWKEENITLPNGGEIHYSYDLLGNMIKVTDPEGRKTVYSHDNNGNVLSVGTEDENKEVRIGTSYTYDKLGRIKTETDGEGNTTSYSYDKNGNLTSRMDALGGRTCYEYDAAGRVVSMTDAIGRNTSYTYDRSGNLETVTDPAKVVTTNHYEKGRLIKVTRKAEDTEEITLKSYEYDLCGRISKETERDGFALAYEYDKAGRIKTVTGSNKRVMTYSYDPMGRVVETDDCGAKTRYTYTGTGKLKSVTDALGNRTTYEYNELDLLCRIEREGNGQDTEENTQQDRRYPSADGNGHVTVFKHDLSGKLVSETDALGQKTIYTYDEAGDLKSLTDRDGNETVYTRDKNGNITGIKYADGKEILYKYNALNILKEVQDRIGLTKIETDEVGRTILVTDPNGETVGYEYGPRDEKTAVVYPDGKKAEYRYDAFGNLIELREVSDREEGSIRYSYNENGHLSERIFPNGTGTFYDYYQGGLLKSLTSADKEGILDRYEYAYNEKENRTQIKRYRRGLANVSGVYAYSYDELGRLTGIEKDGIKSAGYTYDAFGNRESLTEEGNRTVYSYDVLDRLISKTEERASGNNTFTYAYDRRGNLTREYEGDILKAIYDYNDQGMLEKTVIDPESELRKEISYTYNFAGQRVSKRSGLEEVRYLTDVTRDHYNLLGETKNGKTKTFIYDDNVVSFEQEGKRNYYQLDELGSTMYLTGTDGGAYSPYAYDPFGNRIDPVTGKRRTTSQNHGYSIEGNLIQPFAFTGYREEESGLYYAQARSYDPGAGRFTGEDKVRGILAIPETQNHYSYCLSNPIIMVDTNGLWPTVLVGAVGGAIVGAVSYTVGAVVSGEKIDATQMLASAAGGAAAGALIGSGVVDPTIVGAAAGAASGFVTGTAQAINDVKDTVKKGGSARDIAGSVVNGLGTIATSTATGGVVGGVMGTVFGKLGAGAAMVVGGIVKGGMALREELTDDKEGVRWGRVARHTVGGVAETGTAILGFKALGGVLSGKEISNTGKKINAQCKKITEYKNTVKSNYNELKQGMVKGLQESMFNFRNNLNRLFNPYSFIPEPVLADGYADYCSCENASTNKAVYTEAAAGSSAAGSKQNGNSNSSGSGETNSKGKNAAPQRTRKQAFNEAKERAGIPRGQQPVRQWKVGNDVSKKGYDLANYKYDANPGAHGRYYEYDTPNGKVVIVEHTSDGVPHYHAGRAKPGADPFTYDFKNNRYQNIAIPDKNEHIYYGN